MSFATRFVAFTAIRVDAGEDENKEKRSKENYELRCKNNQEHRSKEQQTIASGRLRCAQVSYLARSGSGYAEISR